MQGKFSSPASSDLSFVQEKMKHIKQLRTEKFTVRNAELEDVFKAYRILFDEVIERLPASGILLAKIKREYETAIDTIRLKGQESAATKQREMVKGCEVGTISNYHKRIKELDFKLAKLRVDNERMKNEIEMMRSEIEAIVQEKVYQRQLLKVHIPSMTSTKRRSLGLTLEDVTSINYLQKELQHVRQELTEARIVAEKKYIPGERKVLLRQLLKEKEDSKTKLDSRNTEIAQQLKRLKLATQAVYGYQSYLQKHQLDTSSMPLIHYINAVIESNHEDVSDEEPDDPAKEMEAEMVLDCFEKFNELFEGERYEEAALHAASSPKGVLRTMDTLNKFKYSARHMPGWKLPLLCYCEHLMQCAPAYRPLSLEESTECVQCALDNDGIQLITHWIAQGVLYPSVQVGKLLVNHCQCSLRCTCGCKRVAFSVFDKCGEYKLAALCLVHQEKFMAFLSFAKKIGLTKTEYAHLLHMTPSVSFAEILVNPPAPYEPIVTMFEAANVLLQGGMAEKVATFLITVIKKQNTDHLMAIMDDKNTTSDVWQGLIDNLQRVELNELTVDIVSALTVKRVLQNVVSSLIQVQGYHVTNEDNRVSRYQQSSMSSLGTDGQLSVSSMSSSSESTEADSESGSGYSSEVESESLL